MNFAIFAIIKKLSELYYKLSERHNYG